MVLRETLERQPDRWRDSRTRREVASRAEADQILLRWEERVTEPRNIGEPEAAYRRFVVLKVPLDVYDRLSFDRRLERAIETVVMDDTRFIHRLEDLGIGLTFGRTLDA